MLGIEFPDHIHTTPCKTITISRLIKVDRHGYTRMKFTYINHQQTVNLRSRYLYPGLTAQ